ncbi:MAG: protein kinase domain-containing protein [Steroidobacteraceae bacterium]
MSTHPPQPDHDATRTSHERYQLLSEGTLIAGRYRVRGLLGVGAMGMVYRVHDERLHMDVALKVLRPELAPDARTLERFEQELILARQVSHRNVVRIHDIGEDGELHFLTMDCVEGRSLKQILETQGRLEVERVVSIAHDLAEALAAAHREGIVHRDLKPANVLIGADGRACITDFGIARSLNRSGLTRLGNVVGTLHYLAPEQARGTGVDGRTDLYALGIMIFEMLSGELPFSGETFEEVLAQRTSGRPRELAVEVPAWLRRLVARCLESDPARRYPDAESLAADLAAGKASPGTRRLSIRRRPAALAVGIACGVAAVAAASYWFTRHPVASADASSRAIAVLPLVRQAGPTELGWLSTGLAEMFAQTLAESTNLQVVDSLRVFRTLNDLHLSPATLADGELRRIGELLDVERLIVGTVGEAGGRVRVELRLIDARLDDLPARMLRGEAPTLAGLFGLVDRLGGELREALAVDPAPPSTQALSANPAAMGEYADGLARLLQGDSVGAAPALERAVAADANFPAAWVRLATAYEQLGHDDRALEAAHQAVSRLGEGSGRISFEARAREAALSGDLERAQQILAALVARYPRDIEARVALAEAFGEHGELERARRELAAIVAASPNHPRAWYLAGKYAILSGDSRAAADEHLVRALVIQNKLGNVQGRADAENALGNAHFQLGEFDPALERYGKAIELRRAIGDERGLAATTANVARIRLRQGDLDGARTGLQEALDVVARIGDRQIVANLHNEIGFLEERRGQYRPALDRYRQALAVLRDLGNQRALAESYNNVGVTYYLLGDFDNAAVYARQAIELYRKTDNREGLMLAGQTTGLLGLARGDWRSAEKALLEVLRLSREFKDPLAEAVALGYLGRVAQFQGRFGAAHGFYRDALAVLEPLEDAHARAEFTLYQAALSFDIGMDEEGARGLEKVKSWLATSANREQHADWLRLTALRELRAGEIAAARRTFTAAAEEANESGSMLAKLGAALGRAEAQLAAGEIVAARAALEAAHRDAQTLGHLVLTLQSGELLARARLKAGELPGAERQTRDCLRLAEAHRPYARRYLLHALLADVLRARGESAQAAEQDRAATAERERLREGLDETQRSAFDTLTEVRHIAWQGHIDDDA